MKSIAYLSLLIISAAVLSACVPQQQDVVEQSGAQNKVEEKVEEVVDVGEFKQMQYQFQGTLSDVTNGETVGTINTGGSSSGIVQVSANDAAYQLRAEISDLPDPSSTEFYEGWIVRPEPFDFISTGELRKEGDVWVNEFAMNEDLTDYTKYVLTIEPTNDGPDGGPDPAPAGHVVEGDLQSS